MKIILNGKQITLQERDVRAAKQALRHFLETGKTEAEKRGSDTFYYTLLLVMHVLSGDYIQTLTPDIMGLILNAGAEKSENEKNK